MRGVPEEIPDADSEKILARVCAIDVAEESGRSRRPRTRSAIWLRTWCFSTMPAPFQAQRAVSKKGHVV